MEELTQGRSRSRIAAVAVLVFAALLRLAFWGELRGTELDAWHRFDQSDMATYVEQARRIAAGDLLQSAPYHPYHAWQTIAPPEKWLEWYGPHAFHQAPAYSYLLAALMPLTGDDFALIKILQLILGAGSCVLVFLITQRLAGFGPACAAASLAALYGPLLFLEVQLLREGPALFCILAILLALVRHLGREPPGAGATALSTGVLGIAAGAFSMLHEFGSVVTLAVLIALAARHARVSATTAGMALAGAACGWLLGFSPLLARNLAVGAPPLSVSCRIAIDFVESNVADAPSGGTTFSAPSATAARILDEAHGSLLAALPRLWDSYHGDLAPVITHLGRRFAANFQTHELPDNSSYEFFRAHSGTLRWLPAFGAIFPLGLAGMAAVTWGAVRTCRRDRAPLAKSSGDAEVEPSEAPSASQEVWGRSPAGHLALALLLAGLLAALSLVHTVARFRMYLVPILLVYAGIAVTLALRSIRARRLASAGALGAVALLGLFLERRAVDETVVHGQRRVDYAVACKLAIEDRAFDAAWRFAEESLTVFPGDSAVHATAGWELEGTGERERAGEFYRRALEIDARNPVAREGLARVQGQ